MKRTTQATNNFCSGFTLIELLVVLVIISIIITIASLAIDQGSRSYTVNQEAERLFSTLSYAQKTALLQSTTLGAYFIDNRYQFYQYTPQDKEPWQAFNNNKIFASHTIPSYIKVYLKIPENTSPETDFLQPQIIINTDGSLTPFTLTLSAAKASTRYQISSRESGEIVMEKR